MELCFRCLRRSLYFVESETNEYPLEVAFDWEVHMPCCARMNSNNHDSVGASVFLIPLAYRWDLYAMYSILLINNNARLHVHDCMLLTLDSVTFASMCWPKDLMFELHHYSIQMSGLFLNNASTLSMSDIASNYVISSILLAQTAAH